MKKVVVDFCILNFRGKCDFYSLCITDQFGNLYSPNRMRNRMCKCVWGDVEWED
jgi:hypothetical protein